MSERRGPLAGFIAYYVEAMKPAARALREEARRAGIHLPPSQLGQTGKAAPTPDAMAVDVAALNARVEQLRASVAAHERQNVEARARLDDRRRTTEGTDAASVALARLRDQAQGLLDDVDEDDLAECVITSALDVLGKVGEIVTRELGHDWRGKVRPFGALARRRGTKVGAAWVGDTAGGVEPITLADAVELLAVDRAQLRREADAARTTAGEATEHSREALQRARDAVRQVDQTRRYLDATLRPAAHAHEWCDACEEDDRGRCEDHLPEYDEPELPEDLTEAVRVLGVRLSQAKMKARSAERGRVSVYVDGQLVTGPPAAFEATLEADDDTGSDSAGAGEVVDLSEG